MNSRDDQLFEAFASFLVYELRDRRRKLLFDSQQIVTHKFGQAAKEAIRLPVVNFNWNRVCNYPLLSRRIFVESDERKVVVERYLVHIPRH